MKTRHLQIALVCIVLTGCTLLPRARAEDALDQLQQRIIRVSARVSPSVVHIEAAVRVNNRRNLVTGSGFLMDPQGILLTNNHVVEHAEKVSVVVPGRPGQYTAEVVGTDKQTDLAVVRIHPRVPGEKFPVARLGDSDKLRVGEWVIAIGNPYGLDGTVSLGIVSAKGRDLNTTNLLNDFIQTDAMIDRGSSGGPLINLDGEVVGINSRGQGRGIGFTIPIDTAKRVATDLLGTGEISRGYLGVILQPLSRELAEYWNMPDTHGVVINGVMHDSPAASAGFRSGDIVTRFDAKPISAEKDEDIGQFQRMIARSAIGREVSLDVLREGKPRTLTVRIGTQPKVVPDEEETPYGFTVQEVTARLERKHRLPDRKGVLVSFVERGSAAAEANLSQGDLVERIDDQSIKDLDQFRTTVTGLPKGRPFLVQTRRREDIRFIIIVPRETSHRSETRSEPGGQDEPDE